MRTPLAPAVRRLAAAAVCLCLLGGVASAEEPARAVRPERYPALDGREVGALRWFVKLARQAPGDWSGMGGLEPGQEWLESYRYQLAFMTYFLALQQYHKTPAYRELATATMDLLIQKMVRKDVWHYWAESSKGSKKFNPALQEYGPGWVDPVREKNIMYSGHVMHMVGLYEMLSRNFTYDQPGALTFVWDVSGDVRGKYEYDHTSLVERAYRQITENAWHSVECEMNLVFPECNQHPMLAIMLHDALHGTTWAETTRKALGSSFKEKGFIDPKTHRAMAFYMVEQGQVVPSAAADADGWTGVMMNAWDPGSVAAHYPYQREAALEKLPDGTARAKASMFGLLGEGFFAMLAKELGDEPTARALLEWADRNLNPVEKDGYFYYPRDDARKVSPLTGILLACARANVKDGFSALHNRPWGAAHFADPYVADVPYPRAIVTRAVWDAGEQALVLTMLPGTSPGEPMSFSVGNLDPTAVWVIEKNGICLATLREGKVDARSAAAVAWSDGRLRLSTGLSDEETFVIVRRSNGGAAASAKKHFASAAAAGRPPQQPLPGAREACDGVWAGGRKGSPAYPRDERNMSTHTLRAHEREFAPLVAFASSEMRCADPAEFKPAVVRAYLAHLHGERLARVSAQRALEAIRPWRQPLPWAARTASLPG